MHLPESICSILSVVIFFLEILTTTIELQQSWIKVKAEIKYDLLILCPSDFLDFFAWSIH
jgi:hypothetical protein